MASDSLEFRVGLTIFLAALILVVGIMWFQGFKIRSETYVIYAAFPMVGGIDPGDEVNINGVEKGEVKRVELRERDVLVTMKINADVKLPDDSRATLQTIGVMGERVVSIILGESESYLEPGSTLRGVYDPGISEALSYMARLMEDLSRLTGDIKEIAGILSGDGDLRSTIENLASITDELKRIITENAPELGDGVRSFKRSADKVDGLLERNSSRLDSMIATLEEVSRDLPELFDRIGDVTESLADLTERLKKNDSTLGALMQDRELLDRLEKAITSLDELVTDIRANPKKYLKVEIF